MEIVSLDINSISYINKEKKADSADKVKYDSIKNTDVTFKKNSQKISNSDVVNYDKKNTLPAEEIDSIFNVLIRYIDESIKSLDSTELAKNINHKIEKENNSINKSDNLQNKEVVDNLTKYQNVSAFLTQLGKEKSNVNEIIIFKKEKKRSFKNLTSLIISPMKHISRMTLPIKISNINANVIKELKEFKISNKGNNRDNKEIKTFLERFKILNKTYEININQVNEKK